jgi:hypothetical protein
VLKSSLDSWYDGTINLQGVDLEFCRNKARSIQAFRSGRAPPDTRWEIQHQKRQAQPFLVGDNLIWIAEGRRHVNIVNMRLMTSKFLVDPSRGEIGQLYAADNLVVFSSRSRGVVFAGELNHSGLVKRFRIQSSQSNLVLTCRRRTVACAMPLETHTLVYIWDFDSSRCRSFEVNRAALQTPMSSTKGLGLLLQPNTETILICHFSDPSSPETMSSSETGHTTLLHWRFSYAGSCLRGAEQELERYDKRGEFISCRNISGLTFIPVSYNGLYKLQCEFNTHQIPSAGPLQYDDNIEAFTSPECPGVRPINTRNRGDAFWWKDVFVKTGAHSEIIVHRGNASVPNPGSNAARAPGQERRLEDLLINDRYIVRSFDDSFDVLCYDHTVQLPGTTGSLHGIGPWEAIET